VFGLAAIVLASVGLYGVMAYAVARRTREIGIRIAIGARPSAVVRQTLGLALRLAALGMLAGAAGSAVLMRLVAPEMKGVSPHDALTFSAVTVLLAVVAVSAALGPAVRASRIDPLRALKWE
jgi:ABC-type antimicrobial peptide transport system permease subunit